MSISLFPGIHYQYYYHHNWCSYHVQYQICNYVVSFDKQFNCI